MKNEKGFSLIELSIVLIIIGLLVSGITGGASLINSARVRATMSEVTNYRIAVNTYYSTKGYYPGDDSSVAASTSKDGMINTILEVEKAWNDLYVVNAIDREHTIPTTTTALTTSTAAGEGGLGYTKNAGAGFMLAYYNGTDPYDYNVLALTDIGAAVLANATGVVSGGSGNVIAGTTGINAGSMDVKMDDGTIDTGLVVGVDGTTGTCLYTATTEVCVPLFSINL
jgi:prepilin-type N-terminal cleavage/methylation domain-containing protein